MCDLNVIYQNFLVVKFTFFHFQLFLIREPSYYAKWQTNLLIFLRLNETNFDLKPFSLSVNLYSEIGFQLFRYVILPASLSSSDLFKFQIKE